MATKYTLSDIARINADGTAVPNRIYESTNGSKYIGTFTKRLTLIQSDVSLLANQSVNNDEFETLAKSRSNIQEQIDELTEDELSTDIINALDQALNPSYTNPFLTRENVGNIVFVKNESDFPTPIDGTIVLNSSSLYFLTKSITVRCPIDINNSSIVGNSFLGTSLSYTSASGSLFVSDQGGYLQNILLSAASGSTIFDLSDTTHTKNFSVRGCSIVSSSIGVIEGYNVVQFFLTAFGLNTVGLEFIDTNIVLLSNLAWGATNTATTFITFTDDFSIIQIANCIFDVPVAKTAIDISAISSIGSGNIAGATIFKGSGTYLTGTVGLEWSINVSGLSTITDEVARGEVYLTTPALTNIATVSTPVKAAGTTTSSVLLRADTNGQSNRLRYLGRKSRDIHVIAAFSATSPANNKIFNFWIYKNGSVVTSSKIQRFIATGADVGAMCISCAVNVVQNDYIELWVENITDNSDIQIEALNLSFS